METYTLTTEEAFQARIALLSRVQELRRNRDSCIRDGGLWNGFQAEIRDCESALLALRRIGVVSLKAIS